MQSNISTLREREERLQQVLLAYLQAVDAGQAPAPHEVLARHPDLAAELTEFFADQDQLGPVLAPLRQLALPAAEPLPRRFGDYQLLEELGRGGMGVVYRARQVSLNRLVALKMIRDRGLASPEDLQRFRLEAESAAHLDHPNIVPIYEVSEHAGQLYFSMKLIEGQSLAAALGAAWGSAAPSAAAKLLATVARAVHHAHQRGILHRDVKPGNILLDSDGVPHVTDFGLAKRLQSECGLTQTGLIVGTPFYMAPEQAAAKKRLTTAADVYSLGVVLYELLTGRVPFRGADLLDILHQVAEQEPTPLREQVPQVDRDLETICLKCLAKDPERRYGTAEALADDLERWLTGVPILARPVGRLERAWRWCRRRPAQAGLAAAVVLLLMGLVAVPSVGLVLLRAEQRQTEAARAEEARRRQQTRQALDLLSEQVIEDLLGRRQELLPEHRQFLGRTLAYYTEFAAETGADESGRAGVAGAHWRVGIIQEQLGLAKEAEAAFEHSRSLFTGLVADFPGNLEYRHELARSHNNLARLFQATGRLAEAETAFRAALDLHQGLCTDAPENAKFREHLAGVYNNLGILLRLTARLGEAETAYEKALHLWRQLATELPAVSELRLQLAMGHRNLGILLEATARPTQAEAAYREATQLLLRLTEDFPTRPDFRQELARAHGSLATLLQRTRRPVDAEAAFREALKVRQGLAADFPTRPEYRSDLARGHGNLATLLLRTGRLAEAEAAYRDAAKLFQRMVEAFPSQAMYRRELALCQGNLASLLRAAGRLADAEETYGAAIKLYQQLVADLPGVPDYQNSLGLTLTNLAILHRQRNELASARARLEQALPHHQNALKATPGHPEYRRTYRSNRATLAETLLLMGEYPAAADAASQLAQPGADPDDGYHAARYLASCAALAAKDPRAAETARTALAQGYTDRALATLRQAIHNGLKDAARLKTDPALQPLRQHPDYLKLLAELENRRQDGRPQH